VPLTSQGVQAWDRYAFVNNNSLRYNDPSGHFACGRDSGMGEGCVSENDSFTRAELKDAISYEYQIDKSLLKGLYSTQLEDFYSNPLKFLTDKENTGFLLDLVDSCKASSGGCGFEIQTDIQWENFSNIGAVLELIKFGSLPALVATMTALTVTVAVAACMAGGIGCAGVVALAPAVALGTLATFWSVKPTEIYFYKEFTRSDVRKK
jgi:hypothetical protein